MAATARDALPERLVIVTGKGGVGKSTVAAALGVAAVRRGLRTIVAELAGRSDVARVLGGEAADRLREMELDSGLHHVRIDHKRGARPYDLVVLDAPATDRFWRCWRRRGR